MVKHKVADQILSQLIELLCDSFPLFFFIWLTQLGCLLSFLLYLLYGDRLFLDEFLLWLIFALGGFFGLYVFERLFNHFCCGFILEGNIINCNSKELYICFFELSLIVSWMNLFFKVDLRRFVKKLT